MAGPFLGLILSMFICRSLAGQKTAGDRLAAGLAPSRGQSVESSSNSLVRFAFGGEFDLSAGSQLRGSGYNPARGSIQLPWARSSYSPWIAIYIQPHLLDSGRPFTTAHLSCRILSTAP